MADTQKIKIQIDGQEAEVTVAAVTEELANLKTEIDGLDEASDRFRVLTDRINELQSALAKVGISLDTTEAAKGLGDISDSIERISNLEVDPIVVPIKADSQTIDADLGQISTEPILIPVEIDANDAQSKLDSISSDPIEIDVKANAEQAQAEIDSILVDPISVQVDANTDQAQSKIDEIGAKELELPVDADISTAESSISQIKTEPVSVEVDADIEPAQTEIEQIAAQPITVPVDADVAPAQEEIDSLSADTVKVDVQAEGLPDFQAEPVIVPVRTDITEATDSIGELKDELSVPIEIPLSEEKANASIQELKRQLKQAQDEIANTEVGSKAFIDATQRAGELKDRIQDIGEAINQQKGEPIERLGSQFRGLGDSITNLDFKKAGDQFKTFSQTIGQVDIKGLASNAGQLGKTIGGGLVDSFKTLGRVIIANPLLLLATVVIGIGTALFKLKDNIKPVQVAFDAIGDAIGFVTDLLKGFSDLIGLTNFAETDAIAKTTKAYEDQKKAIETTTKQAIASAKARGATQEELLTLQLLAAEKQKKALEPVVAAEANLLKSLQARKDAGRELSDEQQSQYDKAIENANEYKDVNIEINQVLKDQNDLARERANAEIAAEDQIAVLTAKTDGQRVEAQKTQIANAARAAAEKARLEGKSQAEINAILLKSYSDQSKLQDDFDANLQAKAKARRDAIAAIENKYDQDQRTKIEQSFNDDLKRLAENGVREGQVVDQVNKAKLKALDDFDREQRKRAQELADKQIELQNEIAIKSAEAQKRLAVESVVDPEVRAQIEIAAEQEITALRIKAIEDSKQRQLAAIAETTAVQIEQAGLTEEAITEIVKNGELEQQKIILESDEKIAKEKEDQAKREKDLVIKSTQEALDEVRKARQGLATNEISSLGILGLKVNLDALQSSIDEEAAILQEQRDNDIISEQEYQDQLTALQEEGAAARKELSASAIQATADQAGQVLSLVSDALNAQRESDQARIETERSELQAQYEQRKAFIEANIKDETARANALAVLDKDFAAANQKLDKQQLELKKRAIRQERDVAIAQIALSTATAIAGVLAQGAISANPISFALILASGLATIALTVAKAQAALKQADAAAAKFGAGGGGGDIPIPSTGGAGGQSAPEQNPQVPTFAPGGVNPANGQEGQSDQPIVVNAQVSVIDINTAQRRVSVAETGASIG